MLIKAECSCCGKIGTYEMNQEEEKTSLGIRSSEGIWEPFKIFSQRFLHGFGVEQLISILEAFVSVLIVVVSKRRCSYEKIL